VRRLVVLSVLAVAGFAHAQPAERARRVDLASAHYAAARYDEALVELEAAYKADPQPELLFAIAQAYKAKQDCAKAIKAYGDYLRTGPRPAATRMTQLAIDECNTILAAQKPPEAPTEAGRTPTVEPPAPVVVPPTQPMIIREVQRVHTKEVTLPWYRDNWGNVLVGSGLGIALVGTVALVMANSYDSSATGRDSYNDFDKDLAARDRARTVGIVSAIAAGGLVLGGLLHYALRPKKVKTEVLVDPTTRSGSIGVSWSLP